MDGVANELSNKYVNPEDIRTYRIKLSEHSFPPIQKLVIKETVFTDYGEGVAEHVKAILERWAHSLLEIDFSSTLISGSPFWKGLELLIADPVQARISVEGHTSQGPVIRDDDPDRVIERGGKRFYYVKTVLRADDRFYRFYVEQDWLRQVAIVRMSGTRISGYGLTSLIAATGSRLRHLEVSNCNLITDQGVRTIVLLCKSLETLDLSECQRLSPFALMYLAEFPEEQMRNIKLINIRNTYIHPRVMYCTTLALKTASELREFRGILLGYGPPDNDQTGQPSTFRGGQPPMIDMRTLYENTQGNVFTLLGEQVTAEVVKPIPRRGRAHELNLEDRFVNDWVLERVLDQFQSVIEVLVLDGTFITERGLRLLDKCTELRSLSIQRCENIVSKQDANAALMPAVREMSRLRDLRIADSRISGRTISEANLKLTALDASRCPFSAHGLRSLLEQCGDTLCHLRLQGCSYLNDIALGFVAKFRNLELLDLSDCPSLTPDSLHILHGSASALTKLKELYLGGIPRVDMNFVKVFARHPPFPPNLAVHLGVDDPRDQDPFLLAQQPETARLNVRQVFALVERGIRHMHQRQVRILGEDAQPPAPWVWLGPGRTDRSNSSGGSVGGVPAEPLENCPYESFLPPQEGGSCHPAVDKRGSGGTRDLTSPRKIIPLYSQSAHGGSQNPQKQRPEIVSKDRPGNKGVMQAGNGSGRISHDMSPTVHQSSIGLRSDPRGVSGSSPETYTVLSSADHGQSVQEEHHRRFPSAPSAQPRADPSETYSYLKTKDFHSNPSTNHRTENPRSTSRNAPIVAVSGIHSSGGDRYQSFALPPYYAVQRTVSSPDQAMPAGSAYDNALPMRQQRGQK